MGRLRIDGKQTKQRKSVIRVDKENEQLYQANIPEFVSDGDSRYELEDKDQLLWAPHKGLRTATVNKFLRDWKLKRDGMDAEDLDFRPKKIEDSKSGESEKVEYGKQKKGKRKSKNAKEVEIDDTAEELDPIISRFLKNREDELALFALLSSDRKTTEALKFGSRKARDYKDNSKNDFAKITETVEGRERRRSVRRQSRQERMEMETPDRKKRQEERDRARERADLEDDYDSHDEEEQEEVEEEQELKIQEMAFNERQRAIEKNEKMLEKRKAQKPLVKVNKFMERIILTEEIEKVRPEHPISSNASEHEISDRHIAIEVREKWVTSKETEVAAKLMSMKIREKELNQRQQAIEEREKAIEKRKARRPLMKLNANKFMERIIVTEEIENVRPERPISSNAIKLALEGNLFDTIKKIEQDAASVLEDLLVSVVRQVEEKEFLEQVEQQNKLMKDAEKELEDRIIVFESKMESAENEIIGRQLALEKREQELIARESQNSAFMEKAASILGDTTTPIENKMKEMTDRLAGHPTLMKSVKVELLALQIITEQAIFEKDEPSASSMEDDEMVSGNNEQIHQETPNASSAAIESRKKSGDDGESVRTIPTELVKPEEDIEGEAMEDMDLSNSASQVADENAQDESVYENNETLTDGSISRSAKRKEFREDSDYISPKRQRKSIWEVIVDDNNNQEKQFDSLLDILLDEDDSEVEPSFNGGKGSTKSSVRRGRPSVPSRRMIMDERLNEKLCPPEDLLKMEKITKDNLHTYLHLKAESSEEKLENLKFLARYGIIYNEHQCLCKAASTLNRCGKPGKKSDGYHWKCSPCERKSKQGVKVSVRYKCMFATWKQPIASILLAAARLIDNPLDLGDIAKSLSTTMTVESMGHWELSILDVIQVVVLDGATKDQIGGPDKIVDMERGYLHADKFADPKKEKRKREECFIFMERDSPAYSIVRAAAFGQNTLDEVIVRTVREGTKIASNDFDWVGGSTEAAQQQSFVQLHPDRDIRFYKCAAREVSWAGGRNWKVVEDLYRNASAKMKNRGDLTLLYVLNRMFPKPFNAFLLGLSKYDTSNPRLL